LAANNGRRIKRPAVTQQWLRWRRRRRQQRRLDGGDKTNNSIKTAKTVIDGVESCDNNDTLPLF